MEIDRPVPFLTPNWFMLGQPRSRSGGPRRSGDKRRIYSVDGLKAQRKIPKKGTSEKEEKKKEKPLKIRKEFPETWLWAEEKLK